MKYPVYCVLIGFTLLVSSETACNLFSAIDDKLTLSPTKKAVYKTDEQVSFKCAEGYRISGKHVITCRDHGWDGEPPLCLKPICYFPATIDAKLVLTPAGEEGYYRGEQVTFGCLPGHTLIGTSLLKCSSSGWDDEPPLCLSAAEMHILEQVRRISTPLLQRLQAVQRSALKHEKMLEETKDATYRINSRIEIFEKELKLLTSGKCQVRRGWELECSR